MTADIQTILQLLQKQTTVVPPAYSMVTAGAEYQRPLIRLMRTSHPVASIKTDRSFSPSSQVSVDSVKLGISLSGDCLNQNHPGCYGKWGFSSPSVSKIVGNSPCDLHLNQLPTNHHVHFKFENSGVRGTFFLKNISNFFLRKKFFSRINLLKFICGRAFKANSPESKKHFRKRSVICSGDKRHSCAGSLGGGGGETAAVQRPQVPRPTDWWSHLCPTHAQRSLNFSHLHHGKRNIKMSFILPLKTSKAFWIMLIWKV